MATTTFWTALLVGVGLGVSVGWLGYRLIRSAMKKESDRLTVYPLEKEQILIEAGRPYLLALIGVAVTVGGLLLGGLLGGGLVGVAIGMVVSVGTINLRIRAARA